MIYVLTPTGVETVAGSPMHPAVRMVIREQTQLGNHVIDAEGHYLEQPIVTHPLWQDPLLAAPQPQQRKGDWWHNWLHRRAT